MQFQPTTVDVVTQPPQVVHGVRRAEFGGLGDRDDRLLRTMDIPVAHRVDIDVFGCEQAIHGRDGPQLQTRDLLRGTALVDVDVGTLSADDGLPGPTHRLESNDIGARAIEYGEDLSLRTEVIVDESPQMRGHIVITVGDRVIDIHPRDRLQHLGMDPRVVVACEAPPRLTH